MCGEARERALAQLATRQHGVVARRQLRELGLGDEAIRRAPGRTAAPSASRGLRGRAHRASSRARPGWRGALGLRDRRLLRQAAAVALGAPRERRRAERRHRTTRSPGDAAPRVWIHRCALTAEDTTCPRGCPVTTLARTLYDWPKSRLEPPQGIGLEQADRLKLLRLPALSRAASAGTAAAPCGRTAAPDRRARAAPTTVAPRWRIRSPAAGSHRLRHPGSTTSILGHEVDALWPAKSSSSSSTAGIPRPPRGLRA